MQSKNLVDIVRFLEELKFEEDPDYNKIEGLLAKIDEDTEKIRLEEEQRKKHEEMMPYINRALGKQQNLFLEEK